MDNEYLGLVFNEDIYVLDDSIQDKPVSESQAIKEDPVTDIEKTEAEYIYKGSGSVVVVYDNNTGEELEKDHQMFLEKILKAIKLDLQSVVLYNTAVNTRQFKLEEFPIKVKSIIDFGAGLKLTSDLYEPTRVGDVTVLSSNDLSEISEQPNLKQKLWTALKQMFLD